MHQSRAVRIGLRVAETFVIAVLAMGVLAACAARQEEAPSRQPEAQAAVATSAPHAVSPAEAPPRPGYRVVFDDEFDGSQLDASKWTPALAWGPVNGIEQQYYAPDALSEQDGRLTITATRRPTGDKPYTSGAITSHGHFAFAYGYAEARMKLPKGKGLWSAFWLLTDVQTSNQEIDVVEGLGSDPRDSHLTVHYGGGPVGRQLSHDYHGPDLTNGYHTFAVDWRPGSIVWFVDRVAVYRVDRNVATDRMYVTANLAIGAPTSWSGAPDKSTAFPARLEIDYIRVYQRL